MGKLKNMLTKKQIKPIADIYPGLFTIERCESFHIHLRNFRMMFNKDEFEYFCQTVRAAHQKWVTQGRPNPEPNKSLPEYYFNGKIHPTHGERPTDFAIEEQDHSAVPWMPKNMHHIHYKSLRLDVSDKELDELCNLFEKAKKNRIKLKKEKDKPKMKFNDSTGFSKVKTNVKQRKG